VRGPLDLPVLIVAGADLEAETSRLTADLADAVIEASGLPATGPSAGAGSAATALAGHTVGLLNRGTPSGLVTPQGQLTMALMRACSTWPSGVWIDGKKRTSPDGTSFSWQHWSHTFEYALTTGPGDWRRAGFPAAGHDYNHDLLTVVTGLHPGPLPARALLAGVAPAVPAGAEPLHSGDPRGPIGPHPAGPQPPAVLLSALKPHGNPLYPGAQPDPAAGVTARLRHLGGSGTAAARLSLFTGLTGAALTSLCEDGRGTGLPVAPDGATVTVPEAGLTTVLLTPANPKPADTKPADTKPADTKPADTDPFDTEPAQPVFARYWLHGKGPAPAGNVPVAVHLSPGTVMLDEGQATLTLTVACGPHPAAGTVRLEAPAETVVVPQGPLSYDLAPMGYQTFELTVTPRPGSTRGRRFLTAQIDGPAGQLIEDSALLAIGQPPPPDGDLPAAQLQAMHDAVETAIAGEADLSVISPAVALRPGGTGAVEAVLRNHTGSAIRGEAQLISPHGSWRRVGPWATGFALAAGAERTLRFDVSAPATARMGEQWWAIVKVMYFGRVLYSEPVEVTIR
jgi:alpha-mannosidase